MTEDNLRSEVSDAKELCGYVPCFYENIIRLREKTNEKDKWTLWWKRIILFTFLYCLLIGSFLLFLWLYRDHTVDPVPFFRTSFVLATVIFWPLIVTYDGELYHEVSCKIIRLFRSPSENVSWYTESANQFFRLRPQGEDPAPVPVCISILCCAGAAAVYFLKVFAPDLLRFERGMPVCLMVCVVLSALCFLFQKRRRNLLVILFTVCCGVAYFICVMYYFPASLKPLFDSSCVGGHIMLVFLVFLVFFIAGSTLLPMIGLFGTFYLSGFEKNIKYPMASLASSLDSIQLIKRYFMHLTGINLLAYFQLLASVYLLGLLGLSGSLITKALFIAGSFFPITMYLATNMFFKRLSQKIYLLQVEDIDRELQEALEEKSTENAEFIQALVEVRTMYTDEFEIHTEMSKEVLIAMFTPIITSVITILFP